MGAVEIFRCKECNRLMTDKKLGKVGHCLSCRGRKFNGAPTFTWWEWVLIQLRLT